MGYDASGLSVRSRFGQPAIEVIVVGFEVQGRLFETIWYRAHSHLWEPLF
jgi:hypothetical protein